jgi:hypothetical protein
MVGEGVWFSLRAFARAARAVACVSEGARRGSGGAVGVRWRIWGGDLTLLRLHALDRAVRFSYP